MTVLGKLKVTTEWNSVDTLIFVDSEGNESTLTIDPNKLYIFYNQKPTNNSNISIIFNNSGSSPEDLNNTNSDVGVVIENGGELYYKSEGTSLNVKALAPEDRFVFIDVAEFSE